MSGAAVERQHPKRLPVSSGGLTAPDFFLSMAPDPNIADRCVWCGDVLVRPVSVCAGMRQNGGTENIDISKPPRIVKGAKLMT